MTEFKQIIGRGTRINEEFGKSFFTIMDFRNVTDLFADPAFDGDPVMVRQVDGNTELSDEDLLGDEETPVIDEETGEVIDFGDDPNANKTIYVPPTIRGAGRIISEPRQKIYVAGIDVSVLSERVQLLDESGKLITESLRDYTRKRLRSEFRSLDGFLALWSASEKKGVLLQKLEEQGIILENLREEVKKDFDLFDLICHVAWDQPALSRRERANAVKKRDYFTRYGAKARAVLEALLEKYADQGIEEIEEMDVLKVDPLTKLGTPIEIIKLFGGKEKYVFAVNELKRELYRMAA